MRQTPGARRGEDGARSWRSSPWDAARARLPRYVGCALSTIQNTADRDPRSPRSCAQATYNAEIGLLKNIRNAAKKEQYWRAAAWALERRFPRAICPPRPRRDHRSSRSRLLLGAIQRHCGGGVARPLPQASSASDLDAVDRETWRACRRKRFPTSRGKVSLLVACAHGAGRQRGPVSGMLRDDLACKHGRRAASGARGDGQAIAICWPGAQVSARPLQPPALEHAPLAGRRTGRHADRSAARGSTCSGRAAARNRPSARWPFRSARPWKAGNRTSGSSPTPSTRPAPPGEHQGRTARQSALGRGIIPRRSGGGRCGGQARSCSATA